MQYREALGGHRVRNFVTAIFSHFSRGSSLPLRLIGILTLARSDNTQAFQRLRKGLRKYYSEGVDISLHFRFANDETELPSLAAQLLRIPVDVMVTGGMQALSAVTAQSNDVKIVHIGDNFPAGPLNPITGYYFNGPAVCTRQLDKLVRASSAQTTVTVLVDDPENQADPTNNPGYVSLRNYQQATYPQLTLLPLAVTTRAQLHALTPAPGTYQFYANSKWSVLR